MHISADVSLVRVDLHEITHLLHQAEDDLGPTELQAFAGEQLLQELQRMLAVELL